MKSTRAQSGFSLIECLLLLVVMGIVGFVGAYVWKTDRSIRAPVTQTSKAVAKTKLAATSPAVVATPDTVTVKDGLATRSGKGLTVTYPASWDNIADSYEKIYLGALSTDNSVGVGFGAPYGWKYISGSTWSYLRFDADGSTTDNSQKPTLADVNVPGALSTIIIGGGDGGCGARTIAFATAKGVYSVALPWYCEDTGGGPSGIDPAEVSAQLNNVISSIRFE